MLGVRLVLLAERAVAFCRARFVCGFVHRVLFSNLARGLVCVCGNAFLMSPCIAPPPLPATQWFEDLM